MPPLEEDGKPCKKNEADDQDADHKYPLPMSRYPVHVSDDCERGRRTHHDLLLLGAASDDEPDPVMVGSGVLEVLDGMLVLVTVTSVLLGLAAAIGSMPAPTCWQKPANHENRPA